MFGAHRFRVKTAWDKVKMQCNDSGAFVPNPGHVDQG